MLKKPTYEELEQQIRELEHAKFELKRSKDEIMKFRAIADNAVHGSAIVDLDGTIVYLNDFFAKVHGYTPDELTGKNLSIFHNEKQLVDVRRINENLIENGYYSALEVWHTHKDGTEFPMLMSAVIIHDDNDLPMYLGATGIDITKCKRAEAELHESRSKLLRVQYIAGMGDFTWELSSGAVTWSEGMHRLLKYDLNEKIDYAKVDSAIHHPDDLESVAKWLNDSIASGKEKIPSKDYRLVCKDGEVLEIHTEGQIEYKDGEAVKLFGTCQNITERKRSEEGLRESEERFRYLSNASSEAIFFTKNGIGIEANQAAADMFGYDDPSEFIGMFGTEILAPESHEIVKEHMLNNLTTPYEAIGKCKDGSLFPIAIRGKMMPYKNKEIVRATSIVDITSRKQAEEALRIAENTYRNLFLNSQIGLFRTDIKTGLILDANDAVAQFLGYQDRDEILAQPFNIADRYVDIKDREQILLLLKEYGEFKNIEARYRKNDGSIIWMRFSGKLISEKGWIEGVSEDITKEKNAEAKLVESDERLKMVLDGSQLGFWDWDIETNVVYRNERWAEMLGYTLDEIEKNVKQWTDLHHPDDRDAAWQSIQDHLENRTGAHNIEYRMRTKDGGYKWILDQAKIVKRDAHGKPLRMSGTHTDITEIKTLQSKLSQSQKMEAIGTLAGGIAHDFNNMLGVIAGNLSYALNNVNKDDELYEVLSDIQDSSKQAQSLTHQLLTFSKGGAPIKKVSNINKLLKESAIFSSRGAMTNCRFALADDLLMAEVDEGQFNQVIGNLLINANQAMPNGGTITIRTENAEIDAESSLPLGIGGYIKIVVEDQGIGISKKHLSNIFEPYFTTKKEGSGLGLATTYSIIDKHGGHITVYSEIDKGTVLNIYLPASSKNARVTEAKSEAEHSGQGKILIMDDQESILKMAGRILNRMGYDTSFALDGSQAVEIYKKTQSSESPFDLVILDITVPGGMGGLKTIIELLKIDPNVKAAVSSGYSNDPIMANYEDYGFCGVVPKPYTRAQLAEVLNKILGEND